MSDRQAAEENNLSELMSLYEELANLEEDVDARPLSDDKLQRLKEIKAQAQQVGWLGLIEAITDSIEHTNNGYRRRVEKDRAYDSEIAAAAGLMRDEAEQEYMTPIEGLPDTRPPAPQVEDVFNPSASVERALQTGDIVLQAVRELRAARAHGFDLTAPAKCGRMFAVIADFTSRTVQDTSERVAPPQTNPPPGVEAAEWGQRFARTWGDAFSVDEDRRRADAYRRYCEMREHYGLRAVSARQYQRDLEDGLNTVRNYRRTGKIPKRGRKR